MKMLPDKKQLPSFIMRLGFLTVFFTLGGCFMISMPGKSHTGPLPAPTGDELSRVERLKADVGMLAGDIGERNVQRYEQLCRAERYVSGRLRDMGYAIRLEPFEAGGRRVTNIEAELKGTSCPDQVVVIGAHYDSPPGSPGANDNASGVAALLELARQFRNAKPGCTLRFVAFVNEEPPYFQTKLMGSRVYAANAKKRGEKITAMLALEAIGYYSDQPKSQRYPAPFSLLYPGTGNFIGFVGNLGSRRLVRSCIKTFRETTPFPSEGLAAPAFIPGIGWSDQWAFWQEGYPGIMITDTAPFRYPHYHEASDTPDKLDYARMARVVSGVGCVVGELAQ